MIIALGHKKNTGKDAVAAYLTSQYGFRRVAFGDKIRRVTEVAFGFTEEQMTDREMKEEVEFALGISPRRAMQKVGGMFRQHVSNDFWIYAVKSRIGWLVEQGKDIVVSDLRFINELNYIRQMDGKIVKVNRSGIIHNDGDKSETELDIVTSWDYVLENIGDLQELYEKVDEMLIAFGWECEPPNDGEGLTSGEP